MYTSANMDALCTVTNICSYDFSLASALCSKKNKMASTILFATAKMHSEVTHISYNPVFVYANNHLATANITSFVSIFISANMHVAVTTLCSKACEIVAMTVTDSTASGQLVCFDCGSHARWSARTAWLQG